MPAAPKVTKVGDNSLLCESDLSNPERFLIFATDRNTAALHQYRVSLYQLPVLSTKVMSGSLKACVSMERSTCVQHCFTSFGPFIELVLMQSFHWSTS